MGLLSTLSLTGILHEPATIAEMVNAETVTWNMTRPSRTVTIDHLINNYYSDDIISINASTPVAGYAENWPDYPSYGGDAVGIAVYANATVSKGYIHSMTIRFRIDAYSTLYIEPDSEVTFSQNLKIDRIYEPGTQSRDAYVNALHINQPADALIKTFVYVRFSDENNLDHKILVTNEVVYFNGTEFQQINMPIQLEVLAS
jgi:hypothetical protein